MKIYISVDMEGICTTTDWVEVTPGTPEHLEAASQATAEVKAACEGAFSVGADTIVINDAHDSARNLIAAELPENTRLIRGWSRHPYMMMQELDATFDAALMIGYHSCAGSGGNPMAHTMNPGVSSVKINGHTASEFTINWYTAMLEQVPVVFVSGDSELCDHAVQLVPEITTTAVKEGKGASTINKHPVTAAKDIAASVAQALSTDISACVKPLPSTFETLITYNDARDAARFSFFPDAELVSPKQIYFRSDDYFRVLQFFLFVL